MEPAIIWSKQLNQDKIETKLYASDLVHDYATNTIVACFTDKSYVVHKLEASSHGGRVVKLTYESSKVKKLGQCTADTKGNLFGVIE